MNAIVSHPNAFWLANKISSGLGKQEIFFLFKSFRAFHRKKKIRGNETLSRVKSKCNDIIAVA